MFCHQSAGIRISNFNFFLKYLQKIYKRILFIGIGSKKQCLKLNVLISLFSNFLDNQRNFDKGDNFSLKEDLSLMIYH